MQSDARPISPSLWLIQKVVCIGCEKECERLDLVSYVTKGRCKWRKHCKPCWAKKHKAYKQSEAGKKSAAKSAKSEKRKAYNALLRARGGVCRVQKFVDLGLQRLLGGRKASVSLS
jgi:hypothetical protein